MQKDDIVYIEHIYQSILKIKEYTFKLEKAEFLKNSMIQDAVIRQFEIIGEATKKISNSCRDKNNDIPWSFMSAMRNKLIHDYFGVDVVIIWNTVIHEIPKLEEKIKSLL